MIEGLPFLAWPLHRQGLTILIFHRVLSSPDPLRPGEPAAAEFDRFMAYLARHFSVLPLREAVCERLQSGRLPKRACCITFDDGYADNLSIALPILERYHLPATVFVSTGYLDGGRMFNDAVIDAIAGSTLQILDLGEIGLGMHSLETIADRRRAISTILDQLKYRTPEVRQADVTRLIELCGCGLLPDDIMLGSSQVAELSRCGIEIGGHTVDHPILTSVGDGEARSQMAVGKQRLEAIIDKPVLTFAYPNGRPQRDFTADHAAMARDIGFDLAVTTATGVARPGDDVFQLPRFTPWGASMTMRGVRMMRNAWTGSVATC